MRCIRYYHTIRSYATQQSLSHVLLRRANTLNQQYQDLSHKADLDTQYTEETAARQKKIADLQPVNDLFTRWSTAQTTLKELQDIIHSSQDKDMKSLAEEDLETLTSEAADLTAQLERSLMPKHPQSHLPALMEIRAGVGGDEANIFANDMLKMYEKYAAAKRWQIKPYSVSRTEIGDGLTEAIIAVHGHNAFGRLRGEAGVHRVQRTPATETKGRTHTSTVSINVLPELEETEEEDDVIDMSEVKLEVMRSRGAGGQHVNRTESAVRLTHIPTGFTISMQDSRSQHANKRTAFAILRSKLVSLKREKENELQVGLRRSQVSSSDRSEKIRTYNYAQSRVTDHRCGFTSHDLEGIMNGNIDDLLDQVSNHLATEDLKLEEEGH